MKNLINKKIKLELIGLDGNAFSLMGAFTKAARKQGLTQTEIDTVINEATSSDYNHLLATLITHCE